MKKVLFCVVLLSANFVFGSGHVREHTLEEYEKTRKFIERFNQFRKEFNQSKVVRIIASLRKKSKNA